MRISDEPNVEVLREKARILENENSRLVVKTSELLRELMLLKGMGAPQVAQNLPGLLSELSGTTAARGGSERRCGVEKKNKEKKPQRGHGPTAQKQLEVVPQSYDLDEADKACPQCGGELEEWVGHADVSEVVDVVEHSWRVLRRTQKKYRCRCGACVETAEAPAKLIKGGRYTSEVAIHAAVAKYLDAIPLQRQVRQAKRQGAKLSNQSLWDQLWALAQLHGGLTETIKAFILRQAVVGGDESPFKILEKGGAAAR